jgi:hypothetical protein
MLTSNVRTVLPVGEVARDQLTHPALGTDELRGVLRVGVLVEEGDRDVRTLLGEGDRDGPTDAGVAAGDQRTLVPQQIPADIALHLIVRCRLHRAGVAGWFLLLRRLVLLGHLPLPRSASEGAYPGKTGSTVPAHDADMASLRSAFAGLLPRSMSRSTGRSVRLTSRNRTGA